MRIKTDVITSFALHHTYSQMLSDSHRKGDGELPTHNYSLVQMLFALHAFIKVGIHPYLDMFAFFRIGSMLILPIKGGKTLKKLANLLNDSEQATNYPRTCKGNFKSYKEVKKTLSHQTKMFLERHFR